MDQFTLRPPDTDLAEAAMLGLLGMLLNKLNPAQHILQAMPIAKHSNALPNSPTPSVKL